MKHDQLKEKDQQIVQRSVPDIAKRKSQGKSKTKKVETKQKRVVRYLEDAIVLLIDAIVVLVMVNLLFHGAFGQMSHIDSDAARWQCYAVAFWQGWSGFQNLPPGQCTFIMHPDKYLIVISQSDLLQAMRQWKLPSGLIQFVVGQSPDQVYHTLPYEYPWPMLLPFSLGLAASADGYQMAFAIWMLLLAGCIYFVLRHWRSRQAALAYSLYLLVGGWATVAARFDIIPAALTLFAVICTVHKRWNWAFALLALATLSKFYPAVLLVPFLLALQQETQGKWYAWRRWMPMGVFMGICVFVISVSLLLSVAGTLAPLGFFSNRPVQVESLSSSILWMLSLWGKTSLKYVFTFGSVNVFSPLSSDVTFLMTVLLVVGSLYTWWLQWRRHIDLAMASLLTVLIVIITGKVFSTQYLIWVIPLAAYVGQSNRRWLLFWTPVGCLTSLIYPFIYSMGPIVLVAYNAPFYPATTTRNFLLLGFILTMLIRRSYRHQPLSCDKEQADEGSQSGRA